MTTPESRLKEILEEHRRIADGTAPHCYSTNELCDIILRQAKAIERVMECECFRGEVCWSCYLKEEILQILTGGEK